MPDSFYISLAYNFIWQNQAILLRNKHTCWINKSIVYFFFQWRELKIWLIAKTKQRSFF